MIQKELLNELSRRSSPGPVETGKPQVIDVFDGKIVFRKPIDEKEKNCACSLPLKQFPISFSTATF
jgi:hypothetical protein